MSANSAPRRKCIGATTSKRDRMNACPDARGARTPPTLSKGCGRKFLEAIFSSAPHDRGGPCDCSEVRRTPPPTGWGHARTPPPCPHPNKSLPIVRARKWQGHPLIDGPATTRTKVTSECRAVRTLSSRQSLKVHTRRGPSCSTQMPTPNLC